MNPRDFVITAAILVTASLTGWGMRRVRAKTQASALGGSSEDFNVRVEPSYSDREPIPPLLEEPDGMGRDCVVLAPWGESVIVRFSPEQWVMVQTLALMTGDSVEEVICEVAGERYASGGKGIMSTPPGFEDFLGTPFDQDDDEGWEDWEQ